MNNNPSNRKVKVTFKAVQVPNPNTGEAESFTRPDFYTTVHNLEHVKRIHGRIFKEAVFIDDNEPVSKTSSIPVPEKTVIVEKEVIKEVFVEKELTDENIVLALAKKGKNANSIARTLEIPIADVEKILNKNLTPVA